MVQKAGMSFTLRSTGEIPSNSTQVVIGDTMGELMLLYGIADLAFVGGSLVERGGHNPLEPAAHAIPVLMGPHTFNFKDICARLQQDDGLITVTDVNSLVTQVSNLLTDEDYRLWYGRHAVEVCIKTRARSRVCYSYCNPICRSGATDVDPTVRRDDRQKCGGSAGRLPGLRRLGR
jgi:3-deoxy-D-manno-octulosonic-acid transferase